MNQPTCTATNTKTTPPPASTTLKATKFQCGQKVYYKSPSYSGPAEIVKVDLDDSLEPFYTILLTDDNGKEKQTDDAHLLEYTGQMNHSNRDGDTTATTPHSKTNPPPASNTLKATKFQCGQKVYYKSSSYSGPAEIVKVDFDDALEPFYTILLTDDNGKEKQTDDAHLLEYTGQMNHSNRDGDTTATTPHSKTTPPPASSTLKATKFQCGQKVYYKSSSYSGPAEIVKVDFDDALEPFYTILLTDDNGKEKQTDDAHLLEYTGQMNHSNRDGDTTATTPHSKTTPPPASSTLKTTKFQCGQKVYYKSSSYSGPAEIVKVDFDDALEPFYTILLTNDNRKEKQTDDAHLLEYTGQMNHSNRDGDTTATTPHAKTTPPPASNTLKATKFQCGQKVYYKSPSYSGPAEIVKVDFDDALEPFYTILLTDDNGKEKQTDDAHLLEYTDPMNHSNRDGDTTAMRQEIIKLLTNLSMEKLYQVKQTINYGRQQCQCGRNDNEYH